MKQARWSVLLAVLAFGLGGCVINARWVAEKKPDKPVERAIFLFGVPIYLSSDATHAGCCGEHDACPVDGKRPFPPMPHFHGDRGHWGGPGQWGLKHGDKQDCCKEHGPEKKMECCEKKEGEKKMECCEKKEGEKKMECCEEGAKDKPAAAHEHSAPEAAKKK